ncbi:MAG: hypothetical protein AB7O67_22580 [Vicinamibacterales bacterium]
MSRPGRGAGKLEAMWGGGSVRSIVEWATALLLFAVAGWAVSGPVSSWIASDRPVVPAPVEETRPDGIPAGAAPAALLVFLDGRELRVGEPVSSLNALVTEAMADGPAHVARGEYGDRLTRAYTRAGTRFWVVTERLEPGGVVKVAGIYLR